MKNSFKFIKFCVYSAILITIHSEPTLAQESTTNHMTTEKWDTHYFGRFKLELPANSKVLTDYKIYNEDVELIEKNEKPQIKSAVENYINDLKKGIAKGTSSEYERTVPLSNGSILVVSKLKEFYTLNAYLLTTKNTLYRMGADAITVKGLDGAINKIRVMSESIFFRAPQDAPPAGGFALEAGYIQLDPEQALEGIYMGAQISTHPGTYISLLTQQIAEHEDSLIERFNDNKGDDFIPGGAELMSKTQTLRKRERMIGNLKVEEVAVTAIVNGKRFYTFQIEHKGTLESNTRPFIDLELGTRETGSDFKSDEEALAFWDKVVDSLKPLP
ncbi:T6SS immunity protein Tli4 family protein [Pseudomonas sp. RGM 3321]|uniref:T6SS immunity protein Tli4 family protein n=1 Tax=Pseudomonas sp. RGM 3321 TaxID=2930089 RepID=UPI001FCA8E58|nr:T6SS immunity protein Tli4 family protein [Pseudomonas sp. RGM 3321]MCJ2369824.1 T6SS immunity protein Tli4 family protein [Pseudomonas sp. RGM 3321]